MNCENSLARNDGHRKAPDVSQNLQAFYNYFVANYALDSVVPIDGLPG